MSLTLMSLVCFLGSLLTASFVLNCPTSGLTVCAGGTGNSEAGLNTSFLMN